MKKILIAISFMVVSYSVDANNMNKNEIECLSKWEEFNSTSEEPIHILEKWQQVEGDCTKSGLYYFRLGGLYLSLGEILKAQASYEEALQYPTNFRRGIELAIADVYYLRLLRNIGDRQDNLGHAEKKYQSFIETYKNYYGGYIQYSGLLLVLQRYKESIKIATQGLSLKESSYGYRNITIAYEKLGLFNQSVEAFEKAYSLDNLIVVDSVLMLSASRSYAALGDLQMAKGLLFELAEKVPEIKSDTHFKKAVEDLKKMTGKPKK